jgi:hypothetical protein
LKDPKATSITRVFCVLTDGREIRIKVQSDYSVNPKHWGRNQKVLSANTNAVSINHQLDAFINNVLNIYQEAKAKGFRVNSEFIREQLKPKTEYVSAYQEFWQVWGYYLSFKENNYKEEDFKKFKSLENHLTEFKKVSKTPLSLNTITVDVEQAAGLITFIMRQQASIHRRWPSTSKRLKPS